MSKSFSKSFDDLYQYANNSVKSINESKFIAGIMIVIMNIASRFVTVHISKSMEAYLKYTFSRNVLIFTICWIGSKDTIVAICVTLLFIFFVDYLLNEESILCILPSSFINHHKALSTEQFITKDELDKAMDVLEKAEKQLNKTNLINNLIM